MFICVTPTDNGVLVEVDTNGESRMELPISLPEFLKGISLWKESHLKIQEAFPQLTDVERKFLLTGISVEKQSLLKQFFGTNDGRIYPGIGG